MAEKRGSLVPGVLFIAIGLLLFIRRFFDFEPHWFHIYPVLMFLISVFLFIETVRRRHSGSLFWGVVFFILGIFFCLRNFAIIPHFYPDEYWPVFLVALGAGFVAQFVYRPQNWGVLIPAGLFLFFGVGFSMYTFHGYFWGWESFIENYWPIALILIGILVFVRSLMSSDKEPTD